MGLRGEALESGGGGLTGLGAAAGGRGGEATVPAADGALRARRCLHLFVQDQGQDEMVLGPWAGSLCPGDLAIFVDECRPASPRGAQGLMRLPLAGISVAHGEMLCLLPTVLPGGHPATPLLIRVARGLCHAEGEEPPPLLPHFLDGFLSMLAGTLRSQASTASLSPLRSQVHLPRIKAHLREHLRQPGLSVPDVARDLGLSASQVHRVFAGEGCTVMEWLWRERLEGACLDLSGASGGQRTVGEIALSWGFNDPSHFSYAFKKRYGMAPREWRERGR